MSTDVLDIQMNFEENQQAEADKKLLVLFFRGTLKNEIKSLEMGRPIFDDVDCIKIISPGSRDSFVGLATPDYQYRFADQWAKFKARQDQTMSGTPLNQMPWLSPGQVEEYKAMNCHTVEQLAGMPDNVAQRFMGHQAIKQKAEAYLLASKDAAPLLKMQSELEKRDVQIAELQQQVEAMLLQQSKTPLKA